MGAIVQRVRHSDIASCPVVCQSGMAASVHVRHRDGRHTVRGYVAKSVRGEVRPVAAVKCVVEFLAWPAAWAISRVGFIVRRFFFSLRVPGFELMKVA